MEASAAPRPVPAGVSMMFQSGQLLRLASDARLIALVREHHPGAFEALYNRHHRAILSFCRHMLGDAQEAEDAVQQTFLSAYNDLISSEKPIHLRAWLFQIARNRCYSLLRARREQPAAELEEPATEGLASQVQRRQDLRDLVIDMRRLPDDQRAALVLAELDALSHEEIGEALGVPRDKVKALVFQARESLLASRVARETDCSEIREQLATQRGGALRRGNLRRHLRECAGCRDYRKQVEHQRRKLAALLPVAPTVALKEGVLAATVGGGAAAAGGFGAGGAVIGTLLKSGLMKGAVGALLAGVGTAGTIVATTQLQAHVRRSATAGIHHSAPGAAAAPASTAASRAASVAGGASVAGSGSDSASADLARAAAGSPFAVPRTFSESATFVPALARRHAGGSGSAAGSTIPRVLVIRGIPITNPFALLMLSAAAGAATAHHDLAAHPGRDHARGRGHDHAPGWLRHGRGGSGHAPGHAGGWVPRRVGAASFAAGGVGAARHGHGVGYAPGHVFGHGGYTPPHDGAGRAGGHPAARGHRAGGPAGHGRAGAGGHGHSRYAPRSVVVPVTAHRGGRSAAVHAGGGHAHGGGGAAHGGLHRGGGGSQGAGGARGFGGAAHGGGGAPHGGGVRGGHRH